jgi:hypothetical protein
MPETRDKTRDEASDQVREEWDYEQSRKTVHLSFFAIHFVFFALTNGLFMIINLLTTFSRIWFIYPLLIWLPFLFLHYYLMKGLLSKKFEPFLEKVQRFLGL